MALPKCEWDGCDERGTEVVDLSIQLPDYRSYCPPHAKKMRNRESIRFNRNMAEISRRSAQKHREAAVQSDLEAEQYEAKAKALESWT